MPDVIFLQKVDCFLTRKTPLVYVMFLNELDGIEADL